jgi:UDP-N-acetylglucosamine--N-acetylmuramyl-(pentapeptide) pyrophosphoryl-undecaprenol N-acetylglucosamine transferase
VPGSGRAVAQYRSRPIARVLLTGGGTGGHVYPALAIAEVLRERSPEPPALLFVGTTTGLERDVVPKAGVPLAFVASRPLARPISLDVLHTVAANAVGIVQALRIVARFRPDCVVATGGYVAFPVVLAARVLRTLGRVRSRTALLEPNARVGLTNRLLGPLVDEVWTEAPVRTSVVRPFAREDARRALGLDPAKTTVVVMGGSQGARRLNDAVVEAARRGLPPGWQVLLVSGTRDAERLLAMDDAPGLRLASYLDDPAAAYAAADIVVTRAGASTLAELAATGTPAILVPYPYASADHQMKNAEVVQAAGAARILRDDELSGERLTAELRAALEPATARELRSAAGRRSSGDARARIFERIVALAARG